MLLKSSISIKQTVYIKLTFDDESVQSKEISVGDVIDINYLSFANEIKRIKGKVKKIGLTCPINNKEYLSMDNDNLNNDLVLNRGFIVIDSSDTFESSVQSIKLRNIILFNNCSDSLNDENESLKS